MGYEGMNSVITKLQGGKQVAGWTPDTKLTKENAAEFANDPQVTGKSSTARGKRPVSAIGGQAARDNDDPDTPRLSWAS